MKSEEKSRVGGKKRLDYDVARKRNREKDFKESEQNKKPAKPFFFHRGVSSFCVFSSPPLP
jgi:hypothetical protein